MRRHHILRAKYRVMNWPDMTVVWFGTVTSVSGLIRAPLFGHSSLVLGEGSGVRTSSRANRRIRSGRLGNDNEGGESPARHGCRQHHGNHRMQDGLRRPVFPAQPAEPARQHRRFICRTPRLTLRTIYSACLAGTPRPDLAAGAGRTGSSRAGPRPPRAPSYCPVFSGPG